MRINGKKSTLASSKNKKEVYSPSTKAQVQFRSLAIEAISPLCDNKLPIYASRAVEISIKFYFKRPIDHFHPKLQVRDNLKQEFFTARPFNIGGDIDNHIKFVLDAMNNVLYNDDRQVMKIEVKKKYSDTEDERTEIICSAGGFDPIFIDLTQL